MGVYVFVHEASGGSTLWPRAVKGGVARYVAYCCMYPSWSFDGISRVRARAE